MQRYIVQPSEKPNYYVCTDTKNLIVCVWENKKFNDTQQMTTLQDFDPANFIKLTTYMREMGDYLRENHYSKIF